MDSNKDWYVVENIAEIDSPALLIYPERIRENIKRMIHAVGSSKRLRPHVKTHKMAEVVRLQQEHGINKFKCATIAEAEMLALEKAEDVLFAYQATGPKISRLCKLVHRYPSTSFSVLVDNKNSAREISAVFQANDQTIGVYLDLDVGMHRTGIAPENALALFFLCEELPALQAKGIHAYDGHIHYGEIDERSTAVDAVNNIVTQLKQEIETHTSSSLEIVVSGSPSFPYHAKNGLYTCSPGTSLLWDWGYSTMCKDQDFLYAGLVMTRVISKPDTKYICLDLGHKNIASEMPFPRVHFPQLPEEAKQIKHSEEHLVLDVGDNSSYKVGQVLYGIPKHICPTVALHDRANVVENQKIESHWNVVARDRVLSV